MWPQLGVRTAKAELEGAIISTEFTCTEQAVSSSITALDVETAFISAVIIDRSRDAAFVRGLSKPQGILLTSTRMDSFPTEHRFLRVQDREQAINLLLTNNNWNLHIDFEAFQEDGENIWEVGAGYTVNISDSVSSDKWVISYRLGQLTSGKPCFMIADLLQP